MSKYPVESSDIEGITAGVNYLLSGPAGLGQNFSGKSRTNQQLSGNFYNNGDRVETTDVDSLFDVSSVVKIDDYTWKLNFTTTQAFPPFFPSNRIRIGIDSTNYPYYGNIVTPIGVVECTVDYVTVAFDLPIDISYYNDIPGTVVWFSFGSTLVNPFYIPFYVDATATINSATDRVFLSGQATNLNLFVNNYSSADPQFFTVYVMINRYVSTIVPDGVNFKTVLTFDTTIVTQSKTTTIAAGDMVELQYDGFYFTSFIDEPIIGNYEYRLEMLQAYEGYDSPTPPILSSINVGACTLTSQVVKQ